MVVVATIPFYTGATPAEFAYVGAPVPDMRGVLNDGSSKDDNNGIVVFSGMCHGCMGG